MHEAVSALIKKLEFEKKHYNRSFQIKSKIDILTYEEIKKAVNKCRECELINTVNKKVMGNGSLNAELMLIGEAPGRNEDMKGEPFIGKAGEKLNQMLKYINIEREDVYISNVVKCRPPNNADPEKRWVETCKHFLMDEINVIRPRVILALGRYATAFLLNREVKMKDVAGQRFTIDGNITVIPTYHPSALLMQKGDAKERLRQRIASDLRSLKKVMEEHNG